MTENKTTENPEKSTSGETQSDEKIAYTYTFSQWLWSEKIKITSYSTAIFVILFIWNFAKPFIPSLEQIASLELATIKISLLLIQFIFIFIVCCSFLLDRYVRFDEKYKSQGERVIYQHLVLVNKEEGKEILTGPKANPETWKEFKKSINDGIKQFHLAWFFCWVGWLALYMVLAHVWTAKPQYSAALITFSNNFSSLMILVMFVTLNFKTIGRPFILFLTIIGMAVIFTLGFIQADTENRLMLFLFLLSSGFFGSVSMALFFGSLNSFFMRTSKTIIICLHFYAALQVLFIFETDLMLKFLTNLDYAKIFTNLPPEQHTLVKDALEKNIGEKINNVMICAYTIALLIKALLFLVVRWLLQTARLTFSMTQRKSFYNINEDDELLKKFVSNTEFKRKD